METAPGRWPLLLDDRMGNMASLLRPLSLFGLDAQALIASQSLPPARPGLLAGRGEDLTGGQRDTRVRRCRPVAVDVAVELELTLRPAGARVPGAEAPGADGVYSSYASAFTHRR